jgi:hypothetical protein
MAAPATLPDDDFGRAKAGESGLDQIHPNEGRQRQPPRIDEVAESETEQHQRAGKDTNERFGFHGSFWWFATSCRRRAPNGSPGVARLASQ